MVEKESSNELKDSMFGASSRGDSSILDGGLNDTAH
jgi:hypothetical protein